MKSTYKKFNLEEALNGAKLETREGLKVKAIHLVENTNSRNPLVIVLEDGNGKGEDSIINCTVNGRYWNDNCDSSLDLFIVKEPKVYYVNVYKFKDGSLSLGNTYDSEQNALDFRNEPKNSTYLKTIEVTDELENPCKDIEIDTAQYHNYWNGWAEMITLMMSKSK